MKKYEQWPIEFGHFLWLRGGETTKILYRDCFSKNIHIPSSTNHPFMAMVLHQQTSKSEGGGQRSLSVSWNQCKCSRKDPRQIWRTAFFFGKTSGAMEVGSQVFAILNNLRSSWWWRASILGRETTQVMIQSPTEHRQVFAKMFSFMTRPDHASCYHSDQRIWEAPWRGIIYPYSGESNNANV